MSARLIGFVRNPYEARAEIAAALHKHPDLSLEGWWCEGAPWHEDHARFSRGRRAMSLDKHVEAFRWARTVLGIRAHHRLPDHCVSATDTYALRVVIQDAGDAHFRRNVIVEEGTIIAAALALGFRVGRARHSCSGVVWIRTPEFDD